MSRDVVTDTLCDALALKASQSVMAHLVGCVGRPVVNPPTVRGNDGYSAAHLLAWPHPSYRDTYISFSCTSRILLLLQICPQGGPFFTYCTVYYISKQPGIMSRPHKIPPTYMRGGGRAVARLAMLSLRGRHSLPRHYFPTCGPGEPLAGC